MEPLIVDNFFAPDGLIAKVKPDFIPREGQADFSDMILQAIADHKDVIAEAPTGLRNKVHHNIQLQRAYDKYGDKSFTFVMVEVTSFADQKELRLLEQQYLDKNTNGLNMAPAIGGDCLSQHPYKDEIRARIKSSHVTTIAAMTESDIKDRWSKVGDANYNWRNGGVSFKPCPTCNQTQISATASTCSHCRDRSGANNPFFNKTHSQHTKDHLREINSGTNSWIKGINPSLLSYTLQYEITYSTGITKKVAGLKVIALEFNVSIAAIHAIISRCAEGKIPLRGKLAGVNITCIGRRSHA